ncbi:fatty acid-binding protein, liver-like [Paramacrobiotus metropolitanus]|uniref:fatty acid-binding protein, liver-like n=1 Tax=Paramacrobiotus metropolitanus TaxID=2943436 RepID=UPI00244620CC|nr:fatty acid-binding protein, liver-like [Paramacrobiotus metropolitanus]
MTDITGKYQLTSSEKFDDYLKAVGVGFALRKLATLVESATIDITKDNDVYTMKTTTTVKNHEVKFKLGEQFTEHTMDGRDVACTFSLDGNKLHQVQRDPKTNLETTAEREFTGDELITTLRAGDVTSVRKYKKVVP